MKQKFLKIKKIEHLNFWTTIKIIKLELRTENDGYKIKKGKFRGLFKRILKKS